MTWNLENSQVDLYGVLTVRDPKAAFFMNLIVKYDSSLPTSNIG